MNIIVFIKQVPDATDVRIDPRTHTLMREGVRSVVNPFDLFAIEEALKLREAHGGRVVVVSMGPPQAIRALREAIAMGADDAALISGDEFAGSDTLATSYALSQAAKKLSPFDLIICGRQATDGDTAQVGPGIAEQLGIPQALLVRRVIDVKGREIELERMTDFGCDRLSLPLPALITVVKEINTPRYASLSGRVRARRMEIPLWGPGDIGCEPSRIGLVGSPTWVEKVKTPPMRKGGKASAASEDAIDSIAEAMVEYLANP